MPSIIDIFTFNQHQLDLLKSTDVGELHRNIDRTIEVYPEGQLTPWKTPFETIHTGGGASIDIALLKYYITWINLSTDVTFIVTLAGRDYTHFAFMSDNIIYFDGIPEGIPYNAHLMQVDAMFNHLTLQKLAHGRLTKSSLKTMPMFGNMLQRFEYQQLNNSPSNTG